MRSHPGPADHCSPPTEHWYLIQCKPRQDARAQYNLERQGYRCYRPIRGVESLIPGYLFVRLDRIHDNWYPIRSTRGVKCIVAFAGEPVPIADETIATLGSILDSLDGQARVVHLLNLVRHAH